MDYDVIIIGGGITGLSAAHTLTKQGIKILILEQEEELGGLAASYKFPDFSIEKYYHHTFAADNVLFELIKELELEKQLVVKTASVGQLIGKKIHRLNTPFDILRFGELGIMDKFRLGLTTLKAAHLKDYAALDKITAREWITRQTGKNVYNKFFAPLINGKFGASADRISAAWIASRIKLRSNRFIQGEKLYYLKDGFNELIDKLNKTIRAKGEIKSGLTVDEIIIDKNKITGVKAGGHIFNARAVISTLPPQTLLKLCRLPGKLADQLQKIAYQGCVCALIGLDRKLTDSYWINIGNAKLPFCLMVEHTNFYDRPEYNSKMIYLCSYIQDSNSPLWKKEAAEIIKIYMESLKEIFGIKDNHLQWWKLARTLSAGPVYTTGYLSLLPPYATGVNGLFIAGMMQSYPERSIDNSILQGKRCAQEALKQLT
jgi:protoporphyrinogen oxidase